MAHSFGSERKVMLLSDIPPCDTYTAGIALLGMCKAIPPASLVAAIVRNPGLTNAITSPQLGIKTYYFEKPNEYLGYGAGPVRSAVGIISDFIQSRISVPHLASQVIDIARRERVTDVWCVLQGQTLVRLCGVIQTQTNYPVFTHVWDPFDWWLRAHRVNPTIRVGLMDEFGKAIGRSAGVICASEPMASDFRLRYKVKAHAVILGLAKSILNFENTEERDRTTFNIAMSGQMYAETEFQKLVKALDEIGWESGGKRIVLHYFGNSFQGELPRNFVDHGWVKIGELVPALSRMDLLYCPYWFAPEYREEATYSFPSKFVTYLASGVPILFHGPSYSSVSQFLAEEPCAFQCNTIELPALIACLREIICDPRKDEIAARGKQVFLEYFTEEVMHQNFLRCLAGHSDKTLE